MSLRRIFCGLLLVFTASPAFGWWDAGHKIIATIAFRQLSAAEQQAVVALLKPHPRWQADFVEWMPDHLPTSEAAEQAEWIFMQAAVWPDLARDFEDAEKARFHRSLWHYVNFPLYLNEADRKALSGSLKVNLSTTAPASPVDAMNIIQALQVAQREIYSPATSAAEKAVLTAWVFHLVGDSHQPLHSTTLFSQTLFPEGCRGGNSIKIKQRENLHSLWDSLLGERLSYRQARNEALRLMAAPEFRGVGEQAAKSLDPATWLQESHQLAQTIGYGPEILTPLRAAEKSGEKPPVITLTDDYLSEAGRAAQKRVLESGYRLAAMLRTMIPAP